MLNNCQDGRHLERSGMTVAETGNVFFCTRFPGLDLSLISSLRFAETRAELGRRSENKRHPKQILIVEN